MDAGPLVALFDKSDDHHDRALKFCRGFKGELITNLAVLTEAVYLLDFSTQAQADFLSWASSGALSIVHVEPVDLRRSSELLQKYSDLPADFADVTLLAMCERLGILEIATVDTDFTVYRLKGKRGLRNVF